jgi:hypothetical protein
VRQANSDGSAAESLSAIMPDLARSGAPAGLARWRGAIL